MCVYICLWTSVSIFVSMCLNMSLYVFDLSTSLDRSIHVCTCIFVYVSIYVLKCFCEYMSICVYICLFMLICLWHVKINKTRECGHNNNTSITKSLELLIWSFHLNDSLTFPNQGGSQTGHFPIWLIFEEIFHRSEDTLFFLCLQSTALQYTLVKNQYICSK